MYQNDEKIYSIDEILSSIGEYKVGRKKGIKKEKAPEYIEIPASFDIETSSFINNGEKCAIMYVWQMSINGMVAIGRTWDEFKEAIQKISQFFKLSNSRRFVLYVHNLTFEYGFLFKRFEISDEFFKDGRQVLKFLIKEGVEFRCSYALTGKSLERLGESLNTYKVKKLTGNLDYSKIRTPKTKLTNEEMDYCINDVLIVTSYIQELMDKGEKIATIPLTVTGFVRRDCRKHCLKDGVKGSYYKHIQKLQLNIDEYEMLKNTYQGGFTHANFAFVGYKIPKVHSYDFTSSYPSVLCLNKFPMTRPYKTELMEQNFLDVALNHCIMTSASFHNLKMKEDVYETPLSVHKCSEISNDVIENNGRVLSCSYCTTCITELDYLTLRDFYDWDRVEFSNSYIFGKGYLPNELVEKIIEYYETKTRLKGIEEEKEKYNEAKERLNSIYGMLVTDILKGNYSIFEDVKEKQKDVALINNNKSKNRFVYFPFGVWCSAYARRNLFLAIKELGPDYIYADTDSVKFINLEKHKEFFEKYNSQNKVKIKIASDHFKIDDCKFSPENIQGEKKSIGDWDYEGMYDYFKTLGAKKYVYEKNNKKGFAISGLPKTALSYMEEQPDFFDFFDDEMEIPAERSGKMTHVYITEERKGTIKDYTGESYDYEEKSGVYLENCSFNLSMSEKFIKLLSDIFEYIPKE